MKQKLIYRPLTLFFTLVVLSLLSACGGGSVDPDDKTNEKPSEEESKDKNPCDDLTCTYGCKDGACLEPPPFCETVTCGRGVCDANVKSCVNPTKCENDDECLKDFICASDKTCKPNRCDANSRCDKGVCNKDTGACENAKTCESSAQCTDGFECLGNTCTATKDLCAGQCQGSQKCLYDDNARTAKCVETSCQSSVDCLANRICNKETKTCMDADACEKDRFADVQEVNYIAEQVDGSIKDLKLCSNGEKVFTYDTSTTTSAHPEVLVVTVTRPDAEIGLGVITGTLSDPDGNDVQTLSTFEGGESSNSFTIRYEIDPAKNGIYKFRVKVDDISESSANYTVSMLLQSKEVSGICNNFRVLEFDKALAGDTRENNTTLLKNSCTTKSELAYDDVWKFTLNDSAYVSFEATPNSSSDIVLSLRKSCADDSSEIEGACVNSETTGVAEKLNQVLKAGDYYLVVSERSQSYSGGVYSLFANKNDLICQPGEYAQACAGLQTAQVCNDSGTGYLDENCPLGCNNGQCNPRDGEVCSSAIEVNEANPFHQTMDINVFKNSYGGDNICGGTIDSQRMVGHDLVFKATVPKGKTLFASAKNGNYGGMVIYVVEDCQALDTCVDYSAKPTVHDPQTISWKNTTNDEKELFVIIDNGRTLYRYSPTQIDVFVGDQICTPGTRRCVGEGRESQLCNELGTAYDTSEFCLNGCNTPDHSCAILPGNTCKTAELLTPGVAKAGDLSLLTSTTGKPAKCGEVSGYYGDDENSDAFYKVTTTADNKIIELTLTYNNMRPILWAIDGCTADDKAGVCLDGEESTSENGTITLSMLAATKGTYMFALKSGSPRSRGKQGTYNITAEIKDPEGTPYTVGACKDAQVIYYYDSLGVRREHTCSNGCDVATNKCSNPNAKVCAEAKLLNSNTKSSGSEMGKSPQSDGNNVELPSGVVGTCIVEDKTEGPDQIYQFDLKANESLKVDFKQGNNNHVVYLMESCGDVNSCVSSFKKGSQVLNYYAESDKTVYLVIDHTSSWGSSYYQWKFDWSIQTGVSCAPNFRTCTSPTESLVCDHTGTIQEKQTCTDGCYLGGCLNNSSAGSCSSAPKVQHGDSFTLDFTKRTIPSGPVQREVTCLDFERRASGYPYYFKLDAMPGQLIQIDVTNVSGHKPAIVLGKDCSDFDNSCLISTLGESDEVGSLSTLLYLVPQNGGGTYLVGIDSMRYHAYSYQPEGVVDVKFQVKAPECQPATYQNMCTSNPNQFQYCDRGIYRTFVCENGNCSGGKCADPKGDVCLDPIILNPAGGTIDFSAVSNWRDYSNELNPGSNRVDGCIFGDEKSPVGYDIIYSIDLNAGDTFKADLKNPYNRDVLYMLDDCSSSATCLSSTMVGDSNKDRSLIFTAETTKTYYFVFDRLYVSTSKGSNTEIEYTVTPKSAPSCVPGSHYCSDADPNKLIYCNQNGVSVEMKCNDGCEFGYCKMPAAADVCNTAPLLESGFFTIFDPKDHTDNNTTPPGGFSNTCLVRTISGVDAFFRLDLAAYEKVKFTLDRAQGSDRMQMYVFNDCSNFVGSCSVAKYTESSSYPLVEVFEYTADSIGESIIIGFDYVQPDKKGPSTILIERTLPECSPGVTASTCTADSKSIRYCNSLGFYEEYECETTCSISGGSAQCDQPRGDSCLDPHRFTFHPSSGGGKEATSSLKLGDHTNVFDLQTGNVCTGSQTPGKDMVYSVELTAGQTLKATAVSQAATREDVAIYLTTNCDSLPFSCVAGSDTKGATTSKEEISYTATKNETVYLIVDSVYANTTGTVEVAVEVTP